MTSAIVLNRTLVNFYGKSNNNSNSKSTVKETNMTTTETITETTTPTAAQAQREINRRKGKLSTKGGRKLTAAEARKRADAEGTFSLSGKALKALATAEGAVAAKIEVGNVGTEKVLTVKPAPKAAPKAGGRKGSGVGGSEHTERRAEARAWAAEQYRNGIKVTDREACLHFGTLPAKEMAQVGTAGLDKALKAHKATTLKAA